VFFYSQQVSDVPLVGRLRPMYGRFSSLPSVLWYLFDILRLCYFIPDTISVLVPGDWFPARGLFALRFPLATMPDNPALINGCLCDRYGRPLTLL